MEGDKDRLLLKQLSSEISSGRKPQRHDDRQKPRLRGHPKDDADVRLSKTLSWLLRHGAKQEGLAMRSDGYVRVQDLLVLPRLSNVDFRTLERIVQHDAKERYHLKLESTPSDNENPESCWWIRANQGHSMKDVDMQLTNITDAGQIPMAVHGTSVRAWETIRREGLSPMKRTHIHLAQHYSHIKGAKAPPGLRSNSQVLIHVDLDRALQAGIPFVLSANGVVLSKGDETGYLRPEFFKHVTDAHGDPIPGWSVASSGELNCRSTDPAATATGGGVSGGGDVDQASSTGAVPATVGDLA